MFIKHCVTTAGTFDILNCRFWMVSHRLPSWSNTCQLKYIYKNHSNIKIRLHIWMLPNFQGPALFRTRLRNPKAFLVMFNKKRGLTATVEWSLISNCTMIRIRSFCKSMELEGTCPKDRVRICKWTGPSAALCVGPSHCDGGLETSLIAAQNMKWHCSLFGGGWAMGVGVMARKRGCAAHSN